MAAWAAANVNKVMDHYLKNDLLFISDREAELGSPSSQCWLLLIPVGSPSWKPPPCSFPMSNLQMSRLNVALSCWPTCAKSLLARGRSRTTDLASIIESLRKIEESPWKDWRNGKGLNARNLAELLRPYEIRPQNVRTENGRVGKAYKKDCFKDAWERYLPPVTQAAAVKPQTVTNVEHVDDPHPRYPSRKLQRPTKQA